MTKFRSRTKIFKRTELRWLREYTNFKPRGLNTYGTERLYSLAVAHPDEIIVDKRGRMVRPNVPEKLYLYAGFFNWTLNYNFHVFRKHLGHKTIATNISNSFTFDELRLMDCDITGSFSEMMRFVFYGSPTIC